MSVGKITLIIDSGADTSLFKINKVNPDKLINTSRKIKLIGITDNEIETIATADTELNFGNGLKTKHTFHLVPKEFPIQTDGILGRDFLAANRCKIDYESWLLHFDLGNVSVSVPIEDNFQNGFILPQRSETIRRLTNKTYKSEMVVHAKEIQSGIFLGNAIISGKEPMAKFMNTTNKPVFISYNQINPITEPLDNYYVLKNNQTTSYKNIRKENIWNEIDSANIPNFIQKDFKQLISNYSDVFCLSEDALSTNNFYYQDIHVSDNIPTYIPNYKQIHSQTEEIQTQVNKMLNENIVEHSVSPYNSPILLVPKKSNDNNKKWRLVVDFRQLNKKILADKFPLPRIDSILDQLGRAKYFSTLDLMSGFHQIPLSEESRKYTAFSTPSGHYQYTRMPFGLNISPNSFQRMMTIAMAGLTPEHAFIYIDDIIVIGCSSKHHLTNLTKVFERLRQYNLKLNPSKCKFFQSEVTYLGHKITDQGIYPDDSKFSAVKNFPIPTNAEIGRAHV